MRILSIDGWDLPCALPLPSNGNAPVSSLKECMRALAEFDHIGKVAHVLEVANPAYIVTENNRFVGGVVLSVNRGALRLVAVLDYRPSKS